MSSKDNPASKDAKMAQGRLVKRKITKSKKFAALKTDKARLLWFYMLPFTDVEGRIEADPEDIKDMILRKQRRGFSLVKIEECLQDLHTVGLILLYSVDGTRYLQYTKFADEQVLRRDKEASSEIPDPSTAQVQPIDSTETAQPPLSLSLSKPNIKESISIIFEKWNFYKGKANWKSHRELTYEIEQAITEQLKHYSVEQICGAIENYARVLISNEYKWSYAWTLQQFLTRKQKEHPDEKQLHRFLANSFADDDYLTKSAKTTRIRQSREHTNNIRDATEEKLLDLYGKDNEFHLNWLIDKLRPETREKFYESCPQG